MLLPRRLPDAATLDFVARKILKSQNGKSRGHSDKFYAGFNPTPAEVERIREAVMPDGPQYLCIAVARVFLGCRCTPHFGNVLVTKNGELISIDHAHASFKNGQDLRNLCNFIDGNSAALAALGRIAGLTEDDIRTSVEGIPRHTACGSTTGLTDYYCERLQLWQGLFAGHESVAQVAVPAAASA